mgnify:CR=1 FL=1
MTVGVLGTGVPRLSCLRPTAWLHQRPSTAHLHQQTLKTLARGQSSRGGRRKTSSGAVSPGWLARGGEIKARGTSRGSCDASHDDQGQVGTRRAPAHSVLVSSLVLKRQVQARSPEASGKGFHISAKRPRLVGWQDGGHRGAQDGVTTRAFGRRRLPFVRIAYTTCPPSNCPFGIPSCLNIWEEDQGLYK